MSTAGRKIIKGLKEAHAVVKGAKFDERMSAIEPLLTRLTALNAMRAPRRPCRRQV